MTAAPIVTIDPKNVEYSPLHPDELRVIISKGVSAMDVSSSQSEISKQIQKVINDLLLKLSAKSSQYKYVVNVSLVSGSAKDCMGFMGSSWDSSKDGTSTFQIEFGEKTLVVTVIWIYSS